MKTLKTILLIGIVLLVLVSVLILIFAKIYITPEVIKDSLCFETEKYLKREASFNNIEVSLLRGIVLRGVAIRKSLPWENKDIFVCDEVRIKYSLFPLLFKKLLIRKIDFENPTINIQQKNGRSPGLYGRDGPPPDSSGPLGMLFLPGSISAKHGRIVFYNLTDNSSFPLTDFQVSADNISIVSPSEFSISANLGQGTAPDITCQGKFFIPKKELFADVTLQNIPLERLLINLGASSIPVQKGSLTVRSTLTVNASEPLTLNGNISLRDTSFVILPATARDNQTALEGLDANLDFQSAYDLRKGLLTIKKINGKFLSSTFQGDGVIKGRGNNASVSLSLHSARFSLDDLFRKLYQPSTSLAKDLKLAGNIGLRIDIKGKLKDSIFPTFVLKLKDNRIIFPPLGHFKPQLKGELRVDDKNISIPSFKVGTENLSVTVAGDTFNYRKWPPKSNLKIVSSFMNFPDPSTEKVEEMGPFDFGNLSSDGPIRLGDIVFLGMRLNNVQGRYLFENNKLFIKNLKGTSGGGSFDLSATVDLGVKGLDYYLYLKLNDVPLKTILIMFPGASTEFFDGTVSGNCALKGNGTAPTNFLDNLKGDASLYVSNGQIKGLTLVPQISNFIRINEIKEFELNKAQLQFKLRNSIIDLDGDLISPNIKLYPAGEIGLDSSLDIEAQLKISPELFNDTMKIARYLPQENGWVKLPLTIQGTLQSPDVSLSKEALNFILKEALPKLLMDIMSEKEDSPLEEVLEVLSEDTEMEEERVEEGEGQ